MSSGKVDNEYVNDLEAKLTQARQEICCLMIPWFILQRQISQLLLQMSSGKVDNEYVNDLEAKLTQARQEILDKKYVDL